LPILAEKAIEGTSLIEYCQVLVSILWTGTIGIIRITYSSTTRTYPVSYTISREGVMIPGYITTIYPASF
jgi:hypothetical protein